MSWDNKKSKSKNLLQNIISFFNPKCSNLSSFSNFNNYINPDSSSKNHIFIFIFSFLVFLFVFIPISFSPTAISSCTYISGPGEYYITQDLVSSGTECIVIYGINLTLDGNGHTINAMGGVGIYVIAWLPCGDSYYCNGFIYNVTIKNVSIVNATTGILFYDIYELYTRNVNLSFINISLSSQGVSELVGINFTFNYNISNVFIDNVNVNVSVQCYATCSPPPDGKITGYGISFQQSVYDYPSVGISNISIKSSKIKVFHDIISSYNDSRVYSIYISSFLNISNVSISFNDIFSFSNISTIDYDVFSYSYPIYIYSNSLISDMKINSNNISAFSFSESSTGFWTVDVFAYSYPIYLFSNESISNVTISLVNITSKAYTPYADSLSGDYIYHIFSYSVFFLSNNSISNVNISLINASSISMNESYGIYLSSTNRLINVSISYVNVSSVSNTSYVYGAYVFSNNISNFSLYNSRFNSSSLLGVSRGIRFTSNVQILLISQI